MFLPVPFKNEKPHPNTNKTPKQVCKITRLGKQAAFSYQGSVEETSLALALLEQSSQTALRPKAASAEEKELSLWCLMKVKA